MLSLYPYLILIFIILYIAGFFVYYDVTRIIKYRVENVSQRSNIKYIYFFDCA